MTEEQIKELGWKFEKQFTHDQYITNWYRLGCMAVEFTYEEGKLLTSDVTITEVNCMPVTLRQVKLLTELLGKWEQ